MTLPHCATCLLLSAWFKKASVGFRRNKKKEYNLPHNWETMNWKKAVKPLLYCFFLLQCWVANRTPKAALCMGLSGFASKLTIKMQIARIPTWSASYAVDTIQPTELLHKRVPFQILKDSISDMDLFLPVQDAHLFEPIIFWVWVWDQNAKKE